MQEDGKSVDSSYVRVGVKSGGCSGLSYDIIIHLNEGEVNKKVVKRMSRDVVS